MGRRATGSAPEPVRIGDVTVAPGERAHVDLPAARLPTGTWLSLPVAVINGAAPGPRVWFDAAIHGDELNGMEIIRRVLKRLTPEGLAGVVIAVPIVNVFGFVHQDRYLPDRRDLNRCFPGSPRGSLASRLADLFLREVVSQCAYGIDLHTGSLHRTNLPQIRANLADPETRRIAEAFGAPLLYQPATPRGSLRATADRRGIHLLVYEGGEPLRFDQGVIEVGVRGLLRFLAALGMWRNQGSPLPPSFEPVATRWLRAGRSGILRLEVAVGESIRKGQTLGRISDLFSVEERRIKAPFSGLVIGHTNNPLVHQGDALIHVGQAGGRA